MAPLIIDKQHIFTFPHFKTISPSSSTRRLQREDVPYQKVQAYLFVWEGLPRTPPPSIPALGNQLTLTFSFLYPFLFFFLWLFLCFIVHFCRVELGKSAGCSYKE